MKAKKRKILVAISGVAALVLVVGTLAYFNATTSIDNQLNTQVYGAKTIETFTPQQDLQPGKEIEKIVGVTNTGDYDLVVRIKMDEDWARGGIPFKSIAYNSGVIDTVTYSDTSMPTWFATQVNDEDGVVPATNDEESVVYKKFNLGSDWVKGSDSYYYYTSKLSEGQHTGALLEALVLASNTDIGIYSETIYYSTADKQVIAATIADGSIKDATYAWTTEMPTDPSTITFMQAESALETDKEGYSGAQYTLTITTEVCQATAEAVDATWNMSGAVLEEIKQNWVLPGN